MSAHVNAIVTMPPYASFAEEVAAHPIVSGLRLNTVMPVRDGPEEALRRLSAAAGDKTLYVDLKSRQLRVVGAAVPPFTEVRISHRIRVRTPVTAYFGGGRESGRVAAVDGDRLILEDGPRRIIGPGESVNIVCPTLHIEGNYTDSDRAYVSAASKLGLHDFMISFVEHRSDIEELRAMDPLAAPLLKIENAAGIDFAEREAAALGRLIVARGDLHVELLRPHRMIGVLRKMIDLSTNTIVASRLFDSLAYQGTPEAQDITDAAFLLHIGYRTFLLGDEVCLRRDSVMAALNLLDLIAREAP